MENVILVIAFLLSIANFLNLKKLKRRFDIIEIALNKKNLITFDDPARKLNQEELGLLKEWSK